MLSSNTHKYKWENKIMNDKKCSKCNHQCHCAVACEHCDCTECSCAKSSIVNSNTIQVQNWQYHF